MATIIKISKAAYDQVKFDLMQLETDGAGQLDVDYEIITEPPPDLEITAEGETPKNSNVRICQHRLHSG
jgi:hypothetical protein